MMNKTISLRSAVSGLAARPGVALSLLLLPTAAVAADIEATGGVTPTPVTSPVWTPGSIEIGTTLNDVATLTISGTGYVSSTSASAGAAPTTTAIVTITDDGVWESDSLLLGAFGVGTLQLNGNGRLTTGSAFIGVASGADSPEFGPPAGVSSLKVSGNGVWESDSVWLGTFGAGSLEISGHGQVTVGEMNVSMVGDFTPEGAASTPSTIKVSENGKLTVSQPLLLGVGGRGLLEIGDSAYVQTGDILMGSAAPFVPGGEGSSILVNGGTLISSGTITMGFATITTPGADVPTSTLSITGGAVSAQALSLAGGVNTKANIEVSGGSLTLAGSLGVGILDLGGLYFESSLRISGSGTVSNTGGSISSTGGKTAVMEVSDAGRWLNSGTLSISAGGALGGAGHARLEIKDSALVTSVGGVLAGATGGSAIVKVTSGTWLNSGGLSILGDDNTRLEISGGLVTSAGTKIGSFSSGIVDVSGGKWTDSGSVVIGEGKNFMGSGVATLSIGGNGVVSTKEAIVGWGGRGLVQVTGGTWANSASLRVGYVGSSALEVLGDARLEISGSGAVSNANATIGGEGGKGVVAVSGGSWTTSGYLDIGQSTGTATVNGGGEMVTIPVDGGQGTLQISGGSVSAGTARIGFSAGGQDYGPSTGLAQVNGGSWNTTILFVGYGGNGTLELSGTGYVSSALGANVAVQAGSIGAVKLNGGMLSTNQLGEGDGDGTVVFNSGTLRLTANNSNLFSSFETGDVTIASGGATIDTQGYNISTSYVFNGGGVLSKVGSGTLSLNAASPGLTGVRASQGTLKLNAGTWAFSGDVVAGEAGNGNLEINNANVSSFRGIIGNSLSGVAGKVTVNSGTWTTSSDLHVGYFGDGTLEIVNGQVNAGGIAYAGSWGTGHGTIQLSTGGVLAARQVAALLGAGSMIFDGGKLSLTGDQGNLFSSFQNGAVRIDAGGGTIDTQGYQVATSVGFSGSGALSILGNSTLTLSGSSSRTGNTVIGKGTVEISGAGYLGSGTTTVTAGSESNAFDGILNFRNTSNAGAGTYVNAGVTIAGAFGGLTGFYGNSSAGSSTLIALGSANNGGGGIVGFADTSSGGTAAVEVYGNGRLSLNGHTGGGVTIGSLAGDGRVSLAANTLGIGSNNLSTTFSGSIYGTGGITKVGTGTLRLAGATSYSGGTKVQAGTLLISDVGTGASVLGTGDLLVEISGKLGGIGTVLGDATIEGALSPGNSPGSMHFAGDLNMTDTAVIQMEIGGLGYDFIDVDGLLTYDGTLSITLLGSYRPEAGEMFAFFEAGSVAAGTHFDAITFNVSGYQGSLDYGTGVLTIIAVPEPATPMLIALGAGVVLFVRRKRAKVAKMNA